MSEFIASIVGVVAGSAATTLGHIVINHFQTAPTRELDKKRKEILLEMLHNPGPNGWRNMATMSNVIGATREDTARLLIEIGARASETGNDIWALIEVKPLPNA